MYHVLAVQYRIAGYLLHCARRGDADWMEIGAYQRHGNAMQCQVTMLSCLSQAKFPFKLETEDTGRVATG